MLDAVMRRNTLLTRELKQAGRSPGAVRNDGRTFHMILIVTSSAGENNPAAEGRLGASQQRLARRLLRNAMLFRYCGTVCQFRRNPKSFVT